MRENQYQAGLKKRLKSMFPGCLVTKLDSSDIQGIPDLLILYKNKWAILEVKKDAEAPHRPNQDYYVTKLNNMSFSRFIFPENEEEVLNELYKAFKSCQCPQRASTYFFSTLPEPLILLSSGEVFCK